MHSHIKAFDTKSKWNSNRSEGHETIAIHLFPLFECHQIKLCTQRKTNSNGSEEQGNPVILFFNFSEKVKGQQRTPLPLTNGPVRSVEFQAPPGFTVLADAPDLGFVNLNANADASGSRNEPVLNIKDGLILDVVDKIVSP